MTDWLDRTRAWIHHHTRPAGDEGDAGSAIGLKPPRYLLDHELPPIGAASKDFVWQVFVDALTRREADAILASEELHRWNVSQGMTSPGDPEFALIIGDPVTYVIVWLWRNGLHKEAIGLVARIWWRVREKQNDQGYIGWPAHVLLDGLQFQLDGLDWNADDHEQFAAQFWKDIAGPTIDDQWKQTNPKPRV